MESHPPALTPLRRIWLAPVFIYRRLVSPIIGPRCRYSPTCSAYMVQAVARHGIVKGTILGIARILRCNALYIGGWDPVPEEFSFKAMRKTRRGFSERLMAGNAKRGSRRPRAGNAKRGSRRPRAGNAKRGSRRPRAGNAKRGSGGS